jgi:hypothetical protein
VQLNFQRVTTASLAILTASFICYQTGGQKLLLHFFVPEYHYGKDICQRCAVHQAVRVCHKMFYTLELLSMPNISTLSKTTGSAYANGLNHTDLNSLFTGTKFDSVDNSCEDIHHAKFNGG